MLNNKDWILSNRFNPVFRNLTLIEVYSRIRDVTEIPELCTLFNAREEGESKYAAYPGYKDSTYFKVSCFFLHLFYNYFRMINHPRVRLTSQELLGIHG